MERLQLFISIFIQMFALLSPFGVTIFFATNTRNFTPETRHQAAKRATIAILISTFLIFLVGNFLLKVFGITLAAFQIGAGIILLLNSISIVRGTKFYKVSANDASDFAVVPFAIPFTVGPGIIGYLMVKSADTSNWLDRIMVLFALTLVISIISIMIFRCEKFSKLIGPRIMSVIDKLFGLILSAMAAQIIFDGIRHYLG